MKPVMFGMAATPFTAENRIDEPALRAHLQHLAASGIGIYVGAGGAGEGHTMSPEELQRVCELGVEECRGKVPIYASVPEARTPEATIERARLAVKTGVDVVQIFYPDGGHGMRPTPAEQESFYRDLLSAIDHPVALSAHQHSGFFPSVRLLETLCRDYRQIVALNVMLAPLAYFLELKDTVGPRIAIYSEIGSLLQTMTLGGSGCLAAEPNLVPNLCQSIVTSFAAGKLAQCAEAYAHVIRLGAVVNRWAPSTARWVKMGMRVLSLPGGQGPIRKPYLMPPQTELDEMARAFEQLGIRQLEGLA
jgi:4-hydroxy-tetrahydrodipicolinate synthase